MALSRIGLYRVAKAVVERVRWIRRWICDIIADCQNRDVALFHKQWVTDKPNPLVAEQGMNRKDAKALDNHGKGGGFGDGKLIREFPLTVR